MKTYVLKEKPEPPSNGMVWEFDLVKGSIGKNKTGEDYPRRFCFRNALVTFVTNWCKRLALRFSSLRYLTLS
jgi:hypothetical protein